MIKSSATNEYSANVSTCGLTSMGSHRVGHDWGNLAAAAAHPYMTNGKPVSFDYTDYCQQSNVSAF